MSENQSVVCLRHGGLYWVAHSTGLPLDLAQPEHRERLELELQRSEHRVVFAAPGSDIRLLELHIQPEERRHLSSSLPFMLEDSLSEDIESLHFAKVLLSKDSYGVAIVAREQMVEWSEILGGLALRMPWIPEPLLLPREQSVEVPAKLPDQSPGQPAGRGGEWALVIEPESVLLRYGPCEGARIERSLLSPLLDALLAEASPARIVIYGDDETADRALIPSAPQNSSMPPSVEWRRGGLSAAMLLGDAAIPVPNLRQGEFAARLPYARWWSMWRGLAAVLLLALTAHLVSGWLDYRHLEQENLALRGDIETLYRSVNPRGAIADVEKQLTRQLDELRGGKAGKPFTSLLNPLALLASQRSGLVMSSLNYNQRSGQLRLNLLAPSFAEIESLRAALVKAGLDTTLENSSRSGGQVRARLRLETGS